MRGTKETPDLNAAQTPETDEFTDIDEPELLQAVEEDSDDSNILSD